MQLGIKAILDVDELLIISEAFKHWEVLYKEGQERVLGMTYGHCQVFIDSVSNNIEFPYLKVKKAVDYLRLLKNEQKDTEKIEKAIHLLSNAMNHLYQAQKIQN